MPLEKKILLLYPEPKSVETLKNLSALFNLDTSIEYDGGITQDFEYHLTLLLSSNEVDYPNFQSYMMGKVTMIGNEIKMLGDKATCLIFQPNGQLDHLWNQISDEMGIKHYYNDFVAHTSLSYNPLTTVDVECLYIPIIFDRFEIKKCSI